MANREPYGLVQISPTGLLDLLGMKSSGQQPNLFPQVLQPTLDLRPLYAAARITHAYHATAALNAIGVFEATSSVVPPGELWLLERASIVRAAPVTATVTKMTARLCMTKDQSTTPVGMSPNEVRVVGGEMLALGWEGPLIMPAGYGLGVIVTALAGASAETTLIATVGVRLKV